MIVPHFFVKNRLNILYPVENLKLNPKSPIFTYPFFINIFSGFRSRCIIYCSCRYYTPSRIYYIITDGSSSLIVFVFIKLASVP